MQAFKRPHQGLVVVSVLGTVLQPGGLRVANGCQTLQRSAKLHRGGLAGEMDLAQACLADGVDLRSQVQVLITELAERLIQATHQRGQVPQLRLLMLAPPGAFTVVLQRWLPGIELIRMNDTPLLIVRVEALFIALAIHADKVLVLMQVLAQAIGAQPLRHDDRAAVGRQVGSPQPLAAVRQCDGVEAFHQRAVEQLGHDLASHMQPADQRQVQPDHFQVIEGQVAITDAPCLVALIDLVE
ncbi:hypothetical protein D3C77_305140 [compost metagenome]